MTGWVLVVSYHDRSGIRHVWGPYSSEAEATALGEFLQRVGVEGLHETYRLEAYGTPVNDHPEPLDRDPICIETWPECVSGGYDPRCCRFPKSCSPVTP